MTKKEKQPTAETTPAPDSPDLQADYQAAREHLKKLLTEQDDLRAQLSRAGEADFDADQFVAARERLDRLPVFILGAELRAQRARVALLEQRLAAEQETERHEIAAVNKIYEQLQTLESIYHAAVAQRDGARTQVTMTRGDLSSARREIERLLRLSAQPHAPLVRSYPHAA